MVEAVPISPNFIAKLVPSNVSNFYSGKKGKHKTPKVATRKLLENDDVFMGVLKGLKKEDSAIPVSLAQYEKDIDLIVANASVPMSGEDLKDLVNTEVNGIAQGDKELVKCLRLRVYTLRGTKLGKVYVQKLIEDGLVTKETDEQRVERKYDDLYELTGKVDGLNKNEKKVIEIKHVSKDDPPEIIETYKVQCQLYMDLTGYQTCDLHFVHPRGNVTVTQIVYNQDMVAEIHVQLRELVLEIRKYTEDHVKRFYD